MPEKTVLVTGGSGFIGSHLCELFFKRGHRVLCVDNFVTGNAKNLEPFKKESKFELIEHDMSRHIDVTGPVNFIFHFASPASPLDYLRFPIQTLKVGSLGTHNALGLAKAKKAVFLLASTSEVYGDPLVHPQKEEYWGNVNPVGPRGVYDEAKRFAEAMTMAYHRVHGLDAKIVRIFNTYGPRMRLSDGRAIPAFITQALRKEPITVFGDGSQTRSFCYVSDMISGIKKAALSKLNEPVNLGNPIEMSVLDLAKTIISMTKSSSEIVHQTLPVDDPKVRQPDISKAKGELGWEPKIALKEGLNQTIGYFRQNLTVHSDNSKR